MPTKRNWPECHTTKLLDYVDLHGDSLATAGPQRQVGYEKLRKYLNAKCTPRPQPRYTIDEINSHCQYICRTFAKYVGPNLKTFFSQGRKYLRPSLKIEEDVEEDKDERHASPSEYVNLTPTPRSSTLRPSTLNQSRSPSRPLRLRQDITSQNNNKIPKRKRQNVGRKHVVEDKAAPTQIPVSGREELEQLFNLRSKKHRLPFQDIAKGMIRVERSIQKAVDEYLNDGWDLAIVLQQAARLEKWHATTQARTSNTNFLRAIIGWAVFEWVLQDPFPVFGTECGPAWEGLKEVLQQRGAQDYLPYFHNLRLDVQFHLSQNTQFLNETLPGRALLLAENLASVLRVLFLTTNDRGEESLLSTNGQPIIISNRWIPKLQEVFLDVLHLMVKLRQREDPTEFYRPDFETPFDDNVMQAEHNGTREDFVGKRVLITLVPGALGHVIDRSSEDEAEVDVYYKALVLLDLERS